MLKNIISLFVFYSLNVFFWKKTNPESKNIIFYNSEKIGDLMVSSVILENDDILNTDGDIYFVLKDKYSELFKEYKGRVKIIKYNYGLYKWFIPYRFAFLFKLRKLKAREFYNLTPARGILNDEISLLSGANRTIALSKSGKFLKGTAGITDKYYDEIFLSDIKNEYEKHIKLLEFLNANEKEIFFGNKKTFKITGSNYLIYKNEVRKNQYVVISPLSTEPDRVWDAENFRKLCAELSKEIKIVLEGSPAEKSNLEYIRNGNENIIIDTSSLGELPGIIGNCRLFIGGDSGLTHIALKLGKPLLALLDGGYFNRYFPYRENDENINYIYKIMDCFECGFDCIYDKKLCIVNIEFDEVLKKVKDILKKTG
jgi:ADP-heptose:LPS heptosyltransferase